MGTPDFTIRVFCFTEDCPEEFRLGFRRFDSPEQGVLGDLNRNRKLPQVSHPASPAVGLKQETVVMLPKRAALKQSPQEGLLRRPHSLPGLNAGVFRGEDR